MIWRINSVIQAVSRAPGGSFGTPVNLSISTPTLSGLQIEIGPFAVATAVWVGSNGTNEIVHSESTARPRLRLVLAGNGAGRASSFPAGIDCDDDCSGRFPYSASVTLTAIPGPGSSFSGWVGDCSGSGPVCVVSMSEARFVVAGFDKAPAPPAHRPLSPLTPPPSPTCGRARLGFGKVKRLRRAGAALLKLRTGSPGRVTVNASKHVRRSSKRLKRKGVVWLKVRARGKANRRLARQGKVRVKVGATFVPQDGCTATTKTRRITLVRITEPA